MIRSLSPPFAAVVFLSAFSTLFAQDVEELPAPNPIEIKPADENVPRAVVAGEDAELEIPNVQLSLIQNTFIAAPVAGVVKSVAVHEGARVLNNDILVTLNSDQARRELVAAQASLRAAKIKSGNDVDQRYAQRTLAVRETELGQAELANSTYAGAVSENEIQQLQLEVDQAALAIEQAEHQLQISAAEATEKDAAVQISKTLVEQHTVRTQVDGMVVEVDTEIGEWVEAGKPIVRVISLDPIRVECLIDGQKYGSELVGRDVTFSPALGIEVKNDPTFSGKVDFVSPEMHPVTGQIRLWATIRNSKEILKAGMRGTLRIASAK